MIDLKKGRQNIRKFFENPSNATRFFQSDRFYLNDNFESLETVVETFEKSANKHIPIIKALLANPELKLRIEDILARYSDLPILLKNLQKRSISADEAMAALHLSTAKFARHVSAKLDNILEKNAGLTAILNPTELVNLSDEERNLVSNFSPIESVDVERSFSTYGQILTDTRKRLTEENLFRMLFCACNVSLQ